MFIKLLIPILPKLAPLHCKLYSTNTNTTNSTTALTPVPKAVSTALTTVINRNSSKITSIESFEKIFDLIDVIYTKNKGGDTLKLVDLKPSFYIKDWKHVIELEEIIRIFLIKLTSLTDSGFVNNSKANIPAVEILFNYLDLYVNEDLDNNNIKGLERPV